MKKITSFCVDHDHLEKGMYVSREDGDVITYDLPTRAAIWRMRGCIRWNICLRPMCATRKKAMRSCMWGRWAAAPAFTC